MPDLIRHPFYWRRWTPDPVRGDEAEYARLFHQPRHQFDEIAWPVPAVELGRENAFPCILHRAGRAGQREDIGPARNDGTGARLDRRGADRPIAEPAEQLAEARNILRSEEQTSELQSLMRLTSAVFCMKKTKKKT